MPAAAAFNVELNIINIYPWHLLLGTKTMYKDENTDFQNSIFIAKSQIYSAELEHCFSFFPHSSAGKMGRTVPTLTSDAIFPAWILFFLTLTLDRVHPRLSLAAFRSLSRLLCFCPTSTPHPPNLPSYTL